MDIKNQLYAATGKRRARPEYTFRQGDAEWICESRIDVEGKSYQSRGNGKSKKEANNEAAYELAAQLLRDGVLDADEVPLLKEGRNDSSSNAEVWTSNGNAECASYQSEPSKSNDSNTSPSAAYESTGGYSPSHSKDVLNKYLQAKKKIAAACYVITGNDGGFTAEYSFYCDGAQEEISGRGTGSSIKAAEANCAWAILGRLCSLGLVPPKGTEPMKISKKNIPEVVAHVDDELVKRIDRYLDSRGIKPADPDPFSNGGTLILRSKLNEFKTTEKVEPRKLEWAPAMENWNAWRARPIDMPPWNSKTLKEIGQRLLELEREKRANATMKASRESLPIFKHRQQIIDAIESNTVVMIKGATGSGKSTQVCQYLLETYLQSGRGAEFNCYVTQPRRISAVSLAERVAAERSESLERMGQRRPSIGYSIRFQSSPVRPYGGVMFCTVGILLRKMEAGLKGISHVIIDEIHERDVDTDFLLIVVRDLIRAYPNLRLVLMSATIDTKLFTDYFGACPVIEVDGRTFPVQTFYLENLIPLLGIDADTFKSCGIRFDEKNDTRFATDLDEPCDPTVRDVLARLPQNEIPVDVILAVIKNICDPKVDAYDGSILVFVPGWNEISTLMDTLKADEVFADKAKFLILPLHSCLTPQEQRRVFERFPSGSSKRKIILSTNIAETSITIEDVVYVIDSCKVRQSSYTAATNLTVYSDAWASKTNLTQRQGRAGRVQSGYCFRLITEAQYRKLDEHGQAEMLRTPLTNLALMIKLLGLGAVSEFLAKAAQPPPGEAVANALRDLKDMGALEESEEMTDLGRLLARMPIDPKMGKTLVLGAALGVGDLMCTIAAATSFNTPFLQEESGAKIPGTAIRYAGNRLSDHAALLAVNLDFKANFGFHEHGKALDAFAYGNALSKNVLVQTGRASRQLEEVLTEAGFPECCFEQHVIDPHAADDPNLDLTLSLLIYAFYPNVCYSAGKGRYVYTSEKLKALMCRTSVCNQQKVCASPLYVFTEKVQTEMVVCKKLSMITPLQLMLFGGCDVTYADQSSVIVGEVASVKLPPSVATKVVALRPCIEDLAVRACSKQAEGSGNEWDDELKDILRQLSSQKSYTRTSNSEAGSSLTTCTTSQ